MSSEHLNTFQIFVARLVLDLEGIPNEIAIGVVLSFEAAESEDDLFILVWCVEFSDDACVSNPVISFFF